jgi:hypothetical protein
MVAGVLAVAGVSPAASAPSAGWKFARWGMTPAQLGAASHGAVPAGEGARYAAMTGEYAMGQFKFSVAFDYAPPRADPGDIDPRTLQLNAVQLRLDSASGACAELEAYLGAVYGKPDRTLPGGPAGLLWNSKVLGDDVTYYSWDQQKTCSVMYMTLGGHDN